MPRRPSGDNIFPPHECPHLAEIEEIRDRQELMYRKIIAMWGNGNSTDGSPSKDSIIGRLQESQRKQEKIIGALPWLVAGFGMTNLIANHSSTFFKMLEVLK